MLALKLGLVAASVLLASLAARRFGHTVSGTLAGMPMIAGPIMGFVLLQPPMAHARAIALATLVSLPAMVLHLVLFARSASRLRWPAALALANAAYLALGALLTALDPPPVLASVAALVAPAIGLACMPRLGGARLAVTIPRVELALRVVSALAMAAAILLGAAVFPPAVSGLMLAIPITGNVLPCFTLPRDGAGATAALLVGFVRGLFGFAAFFVALYWGLGMFDTGPAYALGWLAALAAALTVYLVTTSVNRLRAR